MIRAWHRLLLAALGLTVGLAGCYVPGGGWTLRTGLDVRSACKPAAFLELVDTRWDEWNRVSQFNLNDNGAVVPVMMEPVPAVEDGSLIPLAAPSKQNPIVDQSVPARGRDQSTSNPPASAPPEPAPRVEDVPLPPAAGNTSAGGGRDRSRRRRDPSEPPGAHGRSALIPASGTYRPRHQFAEHAGDRYDRGPVTLGSPQAAWAAEDDFAENGDQTPVVKPQPSSQRPVIRPRAAARNSASGTWLFSRP